jgi:hypothetical protein
MPVIQIRTMALAVCVGTASGCSSSSPTTSEEATTTTDAPSQESAPSECEPVVDSTLVRITSSLEGDPAPTIAKAQTAEFTVNGDTGRIVVAELAGPGVDGERAVFAIGPSGTIYAEDSIADAFSTLQRQDLDDSWDDAIHVVTECLDNA